MMNIDESDRNQVMMCVNTLEKHIVNAKYILCVYGSKIDKGGLIGGLESVLCDIDSLRRNVEGGVGGGE
jgi:hypothetical protein